ncbi:MAG: glycosyl transferase family 36, partial [Rhodanobacter sp.]
MTSEPSPSGTSATPLHLLSNGQWSTMLSSNGSGFSRWHTLSVTRWREDPVTDPWGTFLLLRDEETGEVWAPTAQPLGVSRPDDQVTFPAGRVCFSRDQHDVHSELEIAVAPADDIELRRLTLSNHGNGARKLSLTSYAELVLGPAGDDNGHPAFSKMFVQTEFDEAGHMLLATRRRRSDSQAEVWVAQAMQVQGQRDIRTTHETDRARFLGRGRTLRDAAAMQPGVALSGSIGCVLDPVFSLRHEFSLAPHASIQLLLWTQVGSSRAAVLALGEKLPDVGAATRLFSHAAQHALDELQRFGVQPEQATRFAHWMGALLGSESGQRATASQRMRGHGGAPTLWSAGISGDRPIALLHARDAESLGMLDDLLLAQRWWRARQLGVDVVVLDCSDNDAFRQTLQQRLDVQKKQLQADDQAVKAEVFCLRDDQVDANVRDGLLSVARLMLGGDAAAAAVTATAEAASTPAPIRATTPAAMVEPADPALEFGNGHGGFVDRGRSYRIAFDAAHPTPAPWTNVIANPTFGSIVTAEGGGYTWSVNSQQNALTPWPNDPVSDMPHDVIYLRDADSGDLWSATALPMPVADAHYTVTHGKGWSRFRNDAHGIALELTQCVSMDDPVKLSRLRLCNRSSRTRRLSVTGYVEWALGANGSTPAPFVVTSRDENSGALFAHNRWRPDFGEHVAFFDMGGTQHSLSGDRAAFLGRLGSVSEPAALQADSPLDGRVGGDANPCGALQTRLDLPPDTQLDLFFMLGDGADEAAAQALVAKYRAADFDAVLGSASGVWNDLLDTLQVRTPDRALDILLNDWLLYQVTVCRLWARTAYYQASGAWGFRDQLQDVMALCVSRPDLARGHLLRAAGRQFAEGDVQHWWLPPDGQGIRTKIRDDRIWLAYVAMHYVEVSGDLAVLDEMLPFLKGQPIPEGATDAFFQPQSSDQSVSLYEHCALAIDSSLTRGAHGLPLIGTGDWNDGMNLVGAGGRGESSWLGWFLLAAIKALTP